MCLLLTFLSIKDCCDVIWGQVAKVLLYTQKNGKDEDIMTLFAIKFCNMKADASHTGFP